MFCCPHCSLVINNVQHCYTRQYSVDNGGQQNIVQSCYTAGSEFLAVYHVRLLTKASKFVHSASMTISPTTFLDMEPFENESPCRLEY